MTTHQDLIQLGDLMGVDRQPCSATAKSTGRRCARQAIPGGTVCEYHGGKAAQVLAKAERRLLEQVPWALDVWAAALRNPDVPWATKVQVGRDVLDRAGVGADALAAQHGRTVTNVSAVSVTTSAPDLDAIIAAALARSAAAAEAYLARQHHAAEALRDATDAEVVEDSGAAGGTPRGRSVDAPTGGEPRAALPPGQGQPV